jgi:hypothetical protein
MARILICFSRSPEHNDLENGQLFTYDGQKSSRVYDKLLGDNSIKALLVTRSPEGVWDHKGWMINRAMDKREVGKTPKCSCVLKSTPRFVKCFINKEVISPYPRKELFMQTYGLERVFGGLCGGMVIAEGVLIPAIPVLPTQNELDKSMY